MKTPLILRNEKNAPRTLRLLPFERVADLDVWPGDTVVCGAVRHVFRDPARYY